MKRRLKLQLQTRGTAAIATSFGVTVGAAMNSVKKKIPAVVIKPHKYNDEGYYLIVEISDGKSALVMEESGGKVSAVRGGLEPSVEYAEGGL